MDCPRIVSRRGLCEIATRKSTCCCTMFLLNNYLHYRCIAGQIGSGDGYPVAGDVFMKDNSSKMVAYYSLNAKSRAIFIWLHQLFAKYSMA